MPRAIWPAIWIPALLATLLLATPAQATAVKKLSDADLVRDAKLIARAECLSISTEWGPERKRIFTRIRFSVSATLKGSERTALEVLLPGGERDGLSYVVHGMPEFRPGEEVVLFLTGAHKKSGICVPVGLGQGLYRIKRERGKKAAAVRDTRSLLLVESGKTPRKGRLERLDLDELLTTVKAEVARQKAAKAPKKQGAKKQGAKKQGEGQ